MCPSMPISIRYPHEEGYCAQKTLKKSSDTNVFTEFDRKWMLELNSKNKGSFSLQSI